MKISWILHGNLTVEQVKFGAKKETMHRECAIARMILLRRHPLCSFSVLP